MIQMKLRQIILVDENGRTAILPIWDPPLDLAEWEIRITNRKVRWVPMNKPLYSYEVEVDVAQNPS